MRKRLVLLLMVFSQPVWAEWMLMESSDSADHYLDPLTLRDANNGRRMWVMLNLKVPHRMERGGQSISSIKLLEEYDCAGERSRSLQVSSHSGAKGTGRVVESIDYPGKWKFVSPDSVQGRFLGFACNPTLRKP